MKRTLQIIGFVLISIGLLVAVYANAYHGAVDYSSKYERNTWYGDASAYIAGIAVAIGVFVYLIARLQSDKQRYTDNA